MSVHINETSPPEHSAEKPPAKTSPVRPAAQDTQKNSLQGSPASKQQVQQEPPQDLNQLARARIIGQVQQRLVQYFIYPTLARRQGWQGQVTLGFKVDGRGSIRHIHVKHSSGYAILDDSAVSAMQQVGQVQLDEIGFMDQFWQLEIPIIYRLEG